MSLIGVLNLSNVLLQQRSGLIPRLELAADAICSYREELLNVGAYLPREDFVDSRGPLDYKYRLGSCPLFIDARRARCFLVVAFQCPEVA